MAEDRAEGSNKTNSIPSVDPSTNSTAAAAVERKTTAAEVEGRMKAAEGWNTTEVNIPCTAAKEEEGQKSNNIRTEEGQDGNSPLAARLARS